MMEIQLSTLLLESDSTNKQARDILNAHAIINGIIIALLIITMIIFIMFILIEYNSNKTHRYINNMYRYGNDKEYYKENNRDANNNLIERLEELLRNNSK
ncbi:MAG: hypothetical protein FWF58_05440 [Firmicutes bacterium]|nr:hypothetical protein [Bacillota bacterium]